MKAETPIQGNFRVSPPDPKGCRGEPLCPQSSQHDPGTCSYSTAWDLMGRRSLQGPRRCTKPQEMGRRLRAALPRAKKSHRTESGGSRQEWPLGPCSGSLAFLSGTFLPSPQRQPWKIPCSLCLTGHGLSLATPEQRGLCHSGQQDLEPRLQMA